MTDLLTGLLQKLDEPLARYTALDRAYAGEGPLTFLSPESRRALSNRLSRMSVNVPRLLVDSIVERLRIVGLTGPGDLWGDWTRNDGELLADLVHREALVCGVGYALVWADAAGRPLVTAESPKQVAVKIDPATRRIVAAIKRWRDGGATFAVLYESDKITRLRANSPGATTAGFETLAELDNPLGQPPVVRFANARRLDDHHGGSEMSDVIPLSEAVVKLTVDMMVGSEAGARPRRWASGVEPIKRPITDPATGEPVVDPVSGEPAVEFAAPFGDGDRFMVTEAADAKFGQLPGADLANYENAVGTLMRLISAVSGLPEHMLGIGGDNPTSADSIRASEAALTARAEAKAGMFGRSWQEVGRLMVAVRDGVDPASVDVGVQWADPSTRSEAQAADATAKLVQAGILPVAWGLRRLGYSAADVEEIMAARRAEALEKAAAAVVSSLGKTPALPQ